MHFVFQSADSGIALGRSSDTYVIYEEDEDLVPYKLTKKHLKYQSFKIRHHKIQNAPLQELPEDPDQSHCVSISCVVRREFRKRKKIARMEFYLNIDDINSQHRFLRIKRKNQIDQNSADHIFRIKYQETESESRQEHVYKVHAALKPELVLQLSEVDTGMENTTEVFNLGLDEEDEPGQYFKIFSADQTEKALARVKTECGAENGNSTAETSESSNSDCPYSDYEESEESWSSVSYRSSIEDSEEETTTDYSSGY